jgi:hypothetical protein
MKLFLTPEEYWELDEFSRFHYAVRTRFIQLAASVFVAVCILGVVLYFLS